MEKQWLLIKLKNIYFWLKNSLHFDGWHDHDVISLRPSKHLWFIVTFFLNATKINIKNTCIYILFPKNPHHIVITKDYYACTSSPYNTNWVKVLRQPYNIKRVKTQRVRGNYKQHSTSCKYK